jgi:antitoxin component YwqK of YwqJK toxin-antitoxin module
VNTRITQSLHAVAAFCYGRGMSTRIHALMLLFSCTVIALPARANNSPEQALKTFKDYVLPKISYACGVDFSAEYDGASLRQHDEYIAQDQVSGDLQCNEPFRYLWFVCQTDAGKAAVKKSGVQGVLCKGTPAKQSTLSLAGGKLVVERAASEDKAYVRLRKQFETLLKVQVAFSGKSGADPYADQTFSDLMGLPNPTLSQSDYCLVNGERLQLLPLFKLERTRDGQIKCWQNGQVIIDLSLQNGAKTGLVTEEERAGSLTISRYKAGKLHGEVRRMRGGKLSSLTQYENGTRVWWQEYEDDGKRISYTRQFPDGQASLSMTADGKVYGLQCKPGARNDKQLQVVCGFGTPRTTRIYDGTNKVNRVETWRDGVLQERGGGDSTYADRSEVKFKDSKKHGRERLRRDDGSLEADVEWHEGVKHGRELQYDESGSKIVTEIVWHAGEKSTVTEYYLNGNRKSLQQFDSERSLREQTFWDNGKLHTEATLLACKDRSYGRIGGFCEQGVVRSYYEDGTKSEEAQYQQGKRHGARNAFWPNGKPAAQEQYADDTLQKAKRWKEDGKLVLDEEYEADGSRKLRR